ncbi:MAG: hypothetical protein AAF384_14275 [Pseudomonadota bacterium]
MFRETKLHRFLVAIFMVGLTVAVSSLDARQFRQFTPIATPQASPAANIPEGATPVEDGAPLTRQEVEPLVRGLLGKWNTAEMEQTLSEQFFDASRLTDAVDSQVPRDARLRLQSIQGIQTLQQYEIPGSGGERGEMVTVVSATVTTQLEFNSPTDGFVRRPGTSEFILEIRNAAPPRIQ